MYLNRENITSPLDLSDRLMQQIKSDNLVHSKVEYRQHGHLSTTEELEPGQINILNDESTILIFSIPLFVLAAVLLLKQGVQKVTKERSENFQYSSKVPCRKCYFFNNNGYLKCAVHPNKVLTKNAEDCHDYQPKK